MAMTLLNRIIFFILNLWYSKIYNPLYFQYLRFKKFLRNPSRPKNILFSDNKDSWKQLLQKGFRGSVHKVFFNEINSKNCKDYDLIIPFTIEELKNRQIQDLLANNPIPLPSVESILLYDDKDQFNSMLISQGLGKYIPSIEGSQAYPYILKKKIDEYGQNSHIIYSNKEEKQYSEKLSSPEYFTQEFIPGKNEYATHVHFEKGKIVSLLNIKYIFQDELSIKGKNKSIKMISPCPYREEFTTILIATGFEGLCCINYKVKDKLPLLIEINPRFGASLSPYFSLFVC